MKQELFKNAVLNNYVGTNPKIQNLVGSTFDVFQDDKGRLYFTKNSKNIIITSPVVEHTSGSAFEFNIHNFVTSNGTGYSFSENRR